MGKCFEVFNSKQIQNEIHFDLVSINKLFVRDK